MGIDIHRFHHDLWSLQLFSGGRSWLQSNKLSFHVKVAVISADGVGVGGRRAAAGQL